MGSKRNQGEKKDSKEEEKSKEELEKEEEQKYKEEVEKEEKEEKERQRKEKEEKKLEEEKKWTIDQEYFDQGLQEWADFYIQFQRYRQMKKTNIDESIITDIFRKDLEKVELFINYKTNDIYEKWACVKDQQKDNDENTSAIKNEIECLVSYSHFHQLLLQKFFQIEFPQIYKAFTSKITQFSKETQERIKELENNFSATKRATERITSLVSQQEEEFTESEEYLKEREKYVLKQNILIAENKRYTNIQLGFVFLIPVIINYNLSFNSIDFDVLPFYRAFFLFKLYATCFAGFLWICSSNKINYKVIFETPYQKENPVFWSSMFNIILMIGCFISIFDVEFIGSPTVRKYCIYLIILQIVLGYRFLLKKIMRAILDPLKFLVEFKSTFIFDQICSITLFMQDIDYCICHQYFEKESIYCIDKRILHKGLLIGAIPVFWRLIQSLIQIFTVHKSKSFLKRPGVYNVMKFSCVLYTIYTQYMKQIDSSYANIWQYSIIISTSFTFFWDVFQDWGLFRPSHFFLKQTLLFKNPLYYVLAIILNFIFRFAWVVANNNNLKRILYIVYLSPFEQIALFASIEIIRRNIWNIFALENQQILLNTQYKVVSNIKGVKFNLEQAQNSKDIDVKKILKNYNNITKKVSFQNLISHVSEVKSLYRDNTKKSNKVKDD